jgi:hypothetical protein
MNMQRWIGSVSIALGISVLACPAFADGGDSACSGLPSQAALQTALDGAVGVAGNGGLGFNMWRTLVANDGTVCAVAFSGTRYTDQWLGSRVISAQKANTANDFSLGEKSNIPAGSLFPNGLALSTANLYSAVQPGGTLYGLQHSNPVDPEVAYHMVAWRVRNSLHLDHFGPTGAAVGGVSGDNTHPDNIIFDFTLTSDGGILNPNGYTSTSTNKGMAVSSPSGFGHPMCLNPPTLSTLPAVQNP